MLAVDWERYWALSLRPLAPLSVQAVQETLLEAALLLQQRLSRLPRRFLFLPLPAPSLMKNRRCFSQRLRLPWRMPGTETGTLPSSEPSTLHSVLRCPSFPLSLTGARLLLLPIVPRLLR